MARKTGESTPSYNTLQNACYWLAMRPEDADISAAVQLTSLLFQKSESEIRKRIAMIQQMAR